MEGGKRVVASSSPSADSVGGESFRLTGEPGSRASGILLREEALLTCLSRGE